MGRVQLRDDYFTELNWNLLHFTTVRALAGTLFRRRGRHHDLRELRVRAATRIFSDVGYSFRVLHDAFGVYQQLLSIDVAVPLNRRDTSSCLHPNDSRALPRLPFTLLITFLPNF